MDHKTFKFFETNDLHKKFWIIQKKIDDLEKQKKELIRTQLKLLIENDCNYFQQSGSASTSNNVIPSNSLLESIETGDLFSQG